MSYKRRYNLAQGETGSEYKEGRYFNRRKNQLLLSACYELLRRNKQEHLLSVRRGGHRDKFPRDAALAVDLLRRYEYYYRIWTYCWGLAADLSLYYEHAWRSREAPELRAYADSSLYFFAQTQYHISVHTAERAGIWIISSADLMTEVPTRLQEMSVHSQQSSRQTEHLIELFVERPFTTMGVYLDRLAEKPIGREIRDRWMNLLSACECPPQRPMADCEAHLIRAHALWYTEIVEQGGRTSTLRPAPR